MLKITLLGLFLIIISCETVNSGIENVISDTKTLVQNSKVKIDNNPFEKKLEKSGIDKSIFEYYKDLNNNEIRYLDYKDDDEALLAKIVMLEYINNNRIKYNVKNLKLDILASRVANKMSLEAAENDFIGHWNMRGEKPYHRYALAGGVDHVSENASAIWSSEKISNSYSNSIKSMKQSHDSFMAEVSPNDGHKKNVIERNHNYVGLGYATIRNQFRYYEEYIDRYIDVNIEKSIVDKNENISISFRPINHNMHPYAVIVYREPPLKEMTRKEINSRSSYHDFSNEVSYKLWPWDLNKSDDSGYTNVKFSFEKNGLYYVDIYLDDQEYKKNSRVDTNGKIRSSGIVFFVK